MSTTNRNKEIFIKGTAIISAIVCMCAVFSYANDTYYLDKATDLSKSLFAAFYMFYFGIVSSDGD